MSKNMKNSEVEAAIRQLANERGIDLTEAIRVAVRLELDRGEASQRARLRRMRSVADRIASLPMRDSRSHEEIIGYDDAGLPS